MHRQSRPVATGAALIAAFPIAARVQNPALHHPNDDPVFGDAFEPGAW